MRLGKGARDIEPSVISVTRVLIVLGLAAGLLSGMPSFAAAGDEKTSDFEETARAAIEVEGNKRVDIATVRSYFHSSPDGHFDEAARHPTTLTPRKGGRRNRSCSSFS